MNPEILLPDYGGRSLSGVLPAIGRVLAPQAFADTGWELPDAPSYVVFLIDGLGADLLRQHAATAPFLSSLLVETEVGTAGVPSTTAVSLASLGVGLPPGSHGIVGYTSRLPGTSELFNALAWSDRVDPLDYQSEPTVFERLGAAGVITTLVNKREFATSGLTRAAMRGADYVGANSFAERIVGGLEATRWAPSLTYLYDSDLDYTGHRYGVASAEWSRVLAEIDGQAEHLRDALPPSARLMIVADHGMVDSPPEVRVDIDTEPGLRDGLTLLAGEARFRHLYVRDGAAETVAATYREVLGNRAVVMLRSEAIAAGWFGAVSESTRLRLGDVMVACLRDTSLIASVDFAYEATMVGMHGSITPAEMRIPLLLA